MTEAENARMRSALLKMSGGMPQGNNLRHISQYAQPSPFAWMGMMTKAAAFIVVGFIIGGTTLSFASLRTLPGDNLYTMKTRVTEKVEDKFTFGVESQARVQAAHVTNRVKEIATVKETGAINNPEVAEAARVAFTENFTAYTEALKTLSDHGRVARSKEIALATLDTLRAVAPAKPQVAAMSAKMAMPMAFSAGAALETQTVASNPLDDTLSQAVDQIEALTADPVTTIIEVPIQEQETTETSVQQKQPVVNTTPIKAPVTPATNTSGSVGTNSGDATSVNTTQETTSQVNPTPKPEPVYTPRTR